MYISNPTDTVINAIIPLFDFRVRCGDARLLFLQHYGIGVEDILADAMRYKLIHTVMVDRVWFDHYADTSALNGLYYAMQGNPAATGTLQGFIKNYIDALYLMYTTNFHYLEMLLKYHHLENTDNLYQVTLVKFHEHGTDCHAIMAISNAGV